MPLGKEPTNTVGKPTLEKKDKQITLEELDEEQKKELRESADYALNASIDTDGNIKVEIIEYTYYGKKEKRRKKGKILKEKVKDYNEKVSKIKHYISNFHDDALRAAEDWARKYIKEIEELLEEE